jgi:hypothetical protein
MIQPLAILAISSTIAFGFAPTGNDRPTLTPQSNQPDQAAPGASKGFFLTMLGRDTLAVEEYVLDATGLRGKSVIRSPRTTVREYTALFDAGGNLTHLLLTTKRAGGEVVSERDYQYSPDSVQVTNRQDTSVTKYAVATHARPFPLFIDMFGPWQAALQHVLAGNKKTLDILASRRVIEYTIESKPQGRYDLVNAAHDFEPLHAELDKGGLLGKFDLTATTDKFIARRVVAIDVDAMAREFAGREKAGSAMGVLSPRDTVRAEINGAHLMIDYGRPSARGRTVFGGIVPWDSIWRTGANAATQLITDKELQFGSVTVPPGTYSLFTVPGKSRWLFIINKQHGQWGTAYDQTKDLARLPMDVKERGEFLERFQFEIEPGGGISFEWEKTVASIPFKVR